MARVVYDGNLLQPVQSVSIQKQFTKTDDGTNIGSKFLLQVNGTLFYNGGSPKSDRSFWTAGGSPPDETIPRASGFSSILRKQEAIRDLFKTEGKTFEIIPLDGTDAIRCNPRVLSIDFPEGGWHTVSNYVINLECDKLYPMEEDTFSQYIESATENWSIESQDPENETNPRTYMLSHNVSAKGKRFYDDTGALVKQAWQQAKEYVIGKLGFDSSIALSSGVNNIPSFFAGYNHVRNEQLDELGGTFSVNETWVLSSGNSLETFTIQSSNKIDTGEISVSINGEIKGLEERNSGMQVTTSKYTNALNKFNSISGLLLGRAQGYSGSTLNIFPLEETIGHNPIAGTVTYNYSYNNRPCRIVPGARSEHISVNDNLGGDVVGVIPVVGRVNGPVLQNIGTKTEARRRLTIEIVMTAKGQCYTTTSEIRSFLTDNPRINTTTGPYIRKIIDSVDPGLIGAYQSFDVVNEETWDGTRYTANIEWIYEN